MTVVGYVLGALALAGQAAVHVQQYASLFHEVRWIGPLFLADAVASLVVIAALVGRRWRRPAALAGIAIAVLALGGLVVSYGRGLFGWQESGFRTPVELAVILEVGAVVFLAIALARTDLPAPRRDPMLPSSAADVRCGQGRDGTSSSEHVGRRGCPTAFSRSMPTFGWSKPE